MPRMRWSEYSSWASSTWSLPSAVWACWAKMSRITVVRSTTRIWSASSSARCWRGRELVVADDHLGLGLAHELAQLVDLARAEVRARVGPAPVLGERRHRVDRRRAEQLLHLGEPVFAVGCRAAGRR